LFLALAGGAAVYQINIVYSHQGDVQISNPETSQAFFDELKGQPRNYFFNSDKDFELFIDFSIPVGDADRTYSYSADIFSLNDSGVAQQVASAGGSVLDWQESYDSLIREYYYKSPDLSQQLPAGKYKIEVHSAGPVLPADAGATEQATADNYGKYVLRVGNKSIGGILPVLNIYWQLPMLKLVFFKTSVLQFFLTPFAIIGIGALGILLVLLALLYYLAGATRNFMKHQQAKTLLLTSNGMQMKEEIKRLLQKPAYDVTVAFITTAAKVEENLDYLKRDWDIMKNEMGFNVEEIDIEGKKENEVMRLLELKDIIFVEGGNAFYLLKAMRQCNFERVIRKLLKSGKVYVGSSAGSIVAGRSIKTALWKGREENIVRLKNLKGLRLAPFNIFVHYQPEYAEIIKKEMPRKWQRRKLKILTDEQAILVQGKEVALIGQGEEAIV
jgi:dipeptidase E